ncbi:MAG TPA: cyclic nucleotide-binding domain-containing protein [Candidatus Sulfotelmatobacter sp.]|jgi:CRP-like cAMP-binding protein
MSRTLQNEVAVLASAKHGLLYLTANDWNLIVDKAARVSFRTGERMVRRGEKTDGVHLLLDGVATVELPARVKFPAIGPGEICGELSFLDELPASANVVAAEPVEALFLDRPTLYSLFELFPHLGSRFYRSLATNLSHRLRGAIRAGGDI